MKREVISDHFLMLVKSTHSRSGGRSYSGKSGENAWFYGEKNVKHLECYWGGLETQKLSLATHWDYLLCWFWMKTLQDCECCPGHYLIVNHYSSMSWFKFHNLSVIVNCVTKSRIQGVLDSLKLVPGSIRASPCKCAFALEVILHKNYSGGRELFV